MVLCHDVVVGSRDSERRFWEQAAGHYDRSQVFFGGPMGRVRELAADAVAGAVRVLEVAAGTGLVTIAIAPRVRHLVATDYADAMRVALRRRVAEAGLTNVEVARADIYALEYAPATFDAVVAANVLHLVPDLHGALASLKRVLRPGGVLVAPVYCHEETLRARLTSRVLRAIRQPMHRRFTTASFRAEIERAGFSVTRSETVPGLIPIGYVEARS